jgi:hypothetical protein
MIVRDGPEFIRWGQCYITFINEKAYGFGYKENPEQIIFEEIIGRSLKIQTDVSLKILVSQMNTLPPYDRIPIEKLKLRGFNSKYGKEWVSYLI